MAHIQFSSGSIRVILPMHVRGQPLIFLRILNDFADQDQFEGDDESDQGPVGGIIFIFAGIGKGKRAVQPHLFRGIHRILSGRKFE